MNLQNVGTYLPNYCHNPPDHNCNTFKDAPSA